MPTIKEIKEQQDGCSKNIFLLENVYQGLSDTKDYKEQYRTNFIEKTRNQIILLFAENQGYADDVSYDDFSGTAEYKAHLDAVNVMLVGQRERESETRGISDSDLDLTEEALKLEEQVNEKDDEEAQSFSNS